MKARLILPLKYILVFFYSIIKLFPTKKGKILFISRQADDLSLDFSMLKEALLARDESLSISCICCRHENKEKMSKFALKVFSSMYHLATSRVCVIDAYWPAVSILKHKSDLTVIQMWHSIGKVKSSGLATVGKPCGRSSDVAKLLDMHKNYDYVVAGGPAWNDFYIQSFGIKESQLLNYGLPRIDYLINSKQQKKKAFFEAYPEFLDKEIILYAPTFRKESASEWQQLIESVDFDKYILVVKAHKKQNLNCKDERIFTCPEFSSLDVLCACDYLITDYSAIAIEAAVINIKTYYFVYDYDDYSTNNGLNINLFTEMPGCVFEDGHELMDKLQNQEYNQKALDEYRQKYLPKDLGTSTEKLAAKIISLLK